MYCISTQKHILNAKKRKFNVQKCNLVIKTINNKITIDITGEPPKVYYKSKAGLVYWVSYQNTIPATAVAEFVVSELYESGFLIHNNRVIDKDSVVSIDIANIEDFDAEEQVFQL